MSNIGGLLIATALLSTLWELAGRRAFLREVLAKAQLRSDVVNSGLQRVSDAYLADVEWQDLIETSSKIDIVVAYATTWRNTHTRSLSTVAARRGTRLRVFLPDPDDALTSENLALRFGASPGEVKHRINAAIESFSKLYVPNGGTVQVFVRAGDPVFSCYRFDYRAVVTLYSHQRDRHWVPTFLVGRGYLWNFLRKEIQAIQGQSKQVFPVVGGGD